MRRIRPSIGMVVFWTLLQAQQAPRSSFRVKYVAEGAVYLDGGRNAGLTEGMKLSIGRGPKPPERPEDALALLEVISVAESSSVCELRNPRGEIRAGDTAFLAPQDLQVIEALRASSASKKYAQVVTFTEGDPLDEEAREAIPKPPLPEINRMRGRIGFEYNSILDRSGSGMRSSQEGLVFRGDMTRIGGSYWNLSGYWRGRMNSRTGTGQETLTDLLNRTYHLKLSYDSPQSPWEMGFGRFYLPWAASLDTIDGGYLGRRLSKRTTAGIFAGSTPDPTSWNYNPDRQLLGSFVNYEGGDFESVRYTSTAGVAVSRINWRPERQFAFFENSIYYKRVVSVYHNLEVDQFKEGPQARTNTTAVGRSFLTVRLQPYSFLSFDVSHNYFRNLPTFDPRLIGTGLIDRLLFQGLSGGFRLELPLHLNVYSSLGRSDRTGDTRSSWNQMYGFGSSRIWRTGLRADARYSRFDSSFGRGSYRSLLFTREIGEVFRIEVQAGQQNYTSALTQQNRSRWVNGNLDWFLSTHYFLGGGFTAYRGRIQNYDQLFFNLGYRF